MHRALGVVLILGGLGSMWLLAMTLFLASSPPAAVSAKVDAVEVAPAATGTPRAEVDETEFDFGVLDVGEVRRHEFVVRNSGDGVLRLTDRGVTCQCTRAIIDRLEVPPGEAANVLLEWKPDESSESFRHGVVLATNDPAHEILRLVATGKVRRRVVVAPGVIAFGDVPRGENRTQKLLVYSEASDSLRVARARPSATNLEVQIAPAPADELERLGARSGSEVSVTLVPPDAVGSFRAMLQLTVETDDLPADTLPQPPLVEIAGRVIGDVSFYGANVVRNGGLGIGVVAQGDRAQGTIYMVVRGKHQDLAIERIETTPDWLEATVTRDDEPGAARARYRIDVVVPPTAPEANFMGFDKAHIKLFSDHPDHQVIDLEVAVAVYP